MSNTDTPKATDTPKPEGTPKRTAAEQDIIDMVASHGKGKEWAEKHAARMLEEAHFVLGPDL